jgi:hypothetical protein
MMDGNDREGMHTQVSTRRKACGCNIRFRGLDSGKNLARMFKVDFPLGSQCQVPCGPVDQAHAEALLQSRDELCHGGWRQAHVFGCARKAAALRHALENGHLIG